jgi:hypothetical protein
MLIAILALPTQRANANVILIMNGAAAAIRLVDAVNTAGQPRDQSLKKIAAELTSVRQRLDHIDEELKAIRDELRRLGAKFDDVGDENARHRVVGHLRTIAANYEGWVQYPTSQNETLAVAALHDLQVEISVLMQRRAYANFATVGYAMAGETAMFNLLNRPKVFQKARFQQYVEYFDGALNAKVPGAIAERNAFFKLEAARIRNVHRKVDQQNPLYEMLGEAKMGVGENEVCDFTIFRVIQGNVESGYRALPGEIPRDKRNCKTQREGREPREPRERGGGEGTDAMVASLAFPLLAQISYSHRNTDCFPVEQSPLHVSTPWACLSKLQKGYEELVMVKQNIDALTQATKHATDLRDRAAAAVERNM